MRTISSLQSILNTYASWSGQCANMQKSSIHFSKGVRPNRRYEFANRLGVQQMQLSDKYLDHQLLRSSYKIDSYEFLNDKFDAKLAGWKGIHLSHAGRLIMIKHVLGLILRTIWRLQSSQGRCWIDRQEQCRTSGGGMLPRRKTHFINRRTFEKSKEAGGPGIRFLQHLTRDMIAKLIWKFMEDEDCLWAQLMRAEYLQRKLLEC